MREIISVPVKELPQDTGERNAAAAVSAVGPDVPASDTAVPPWVPRGVVTINRAPTPIRTAAAVAEAPVLPVGKADSRLAVDVGGSIHVQQIRESLSPGAVDEGLLQTQEPVLRDLTARLATTGNADEVISRVFPTTTDTEGSAHSSGTFWDQLDVLMTETTNATGEPVWYTPEEFTDSLADYADKKAGDVEQAGVDKLESGAHEARPGLTAEQRGELGRAVDVAMSDPLYLQRHTGYHIQALVEYMEGKRVRAEASVDVTEERRESIVRREGRAVETRALLGRHLDGEENVDGLQGAMRSDPHCGYHTRELAVRLAEQHTDMAFVEGYGHTSVLGTHFVVLALPGESDKENILRLQGERGFPREQEYDGFFLFSEQGSQDPDVLPIGNVTVIDPTALQMFDAIPFLRDIPFDQRVAFAQSLAPDSFSTDGIFVGTYSEYVGFCARIGVDYAKFSPLPAKEATAGGDTAVEDVQDEYIGGETGGIPAAIFDDPDPDGVDRGWRKFTTQSGAKFEYCVKKDAIAIEDLDDDGIGFNISVKNGVVKSDINNKYNSGERHPDIYPAQLFEKALEHFRAHGNEVHTIQGNWLQPTEGEASDNWFVYFANLTQFTPHGTVTDDDRKKAAAMTWTGEMAARLGFTEVKNVEEIPQVNRPDGTPVRDVQVTFGRPDEVTTERDDRFIGGKDGGIPKSVFSSDKEQGEHVLGKSGRPIQVLVFPGEIVIKAEDDSDAMFAASVWDGTLSMSINNREPDGTLHPDIYPRVLVDESLSFFERQGLQVHTMLDTWYKPKSDNLSVNYDQYTNNLAGKSPEDITGADKEAAARATWTGRMAASHGYTEVHVDDTPHPDSELKADITVEFTKPAIPWSAVEGKRDREVSTSGDTAAVTVEADSPDTPEDRVVQGGRVRVL